jgi:hypothetical protein
MDHREVFLSVELLPRLWRRGDPVVPCCGKGCDGQATHVLTRLGRGDRQPDRLNGYTRQRTSAWCAEHLVQAMKRRPQTERVDAFERAAAICDELAKAHAEEVSRYRENLARQEREATARDGRILRGSGLAGTLWERADGGWEVQRSPGHVESVCCRSRGSWLIDTRHRDRRLGDPDAHSEDCPEARPDAPAPGPH